MLLSCSASQFPPSHEASASHYGGQSGAKAERERVSERERERERERIERERERTRDRDSDRDTRQPLDTEREIYI